MAQIVVWGTGDTVTGRFKPSKPVEDAAIVSGGSENASTNYQITLSNWNMGGVEYGGYSQYFSFAKRLRLIDLIYVGSSFFSGKTIINNGAPSYGNNSLGYLAAEWIDLAGNKYYSIFAQTSSVDHFFNIENLIIRDSTNNWNYYQDRYSDGTLLGSAGQSFNWSLSNWNSSGTEYGGYSGSFSLPVSGQVIDLVAFTGAWAGSGVLLGNGTYAPNYPSGSLSYNAVRLLGNNGVVYIALIGQFVSSFSISTFTLTGSGFTYYQDSWSSGGMGGDVANPSDSSEISSYEGGKKNPYFGSGCAIAITYSDSTSQELPLNTCPEWAKVRQDDECPEGTCSVECEDHICCYDCSGKAVLVIPK